MGGIFACGPVSGQLTTQTTGDARRIAVENCCVILNNHDEVMRLKQRQSLAAAQPETVSVSNQSISDTEKYSRLPPGVL